MGILQFFNPGEAKKDTLLNDIKTIQSGDESLRNIFINRYRPFILKVISKAAGNRFIEIENSEEFSIGLMAFNDAINSYDNNRNVYFFTYAEIVIKRRILDYLKSSQKQNEVYLLYSFEDEYIENYLDHNAQNQFERLDFSTEMALLEKLLKEFDISLDDLFSASPKHADSKRFAVKMGKYVAEHNVLYMKLVETKKLPKNDLVNAFKVNKKTIEKHRKHIIAACLILRSNLDVLKDFMSELAKGGDRL